MILLKKDIRESSGMLNLKGIDYHINYPILAYFRLSFFYTQDEAICVLKLV